MLESKFNPQNPLDALQLWLESFLNFEKTPKKDCFWLDTMEFLCEKCENPQKSFQSFHIAGSKGKGSVSSFIASILREATIDCGLYTSPHLISFAERITKSLEFLDDKTYAKAYKILSQTVDSIIPKAYPNQREPTWFELVTLFAFIAFREAHFSWAVFETGLGGKLDATNVLLPAASIITEIELEHQEYLGNTIEAIAREKAGIIKNGIPVFTLSKEVAAIEVFKTQAEKLYAPYFHLDDFIEKLSFSYQNGKMNIEASMPKLFEKPLKSSLQLLGEYQVRNALLASLAVRTILPQISQEQIEEGLKKTFIPGRFQIISQTKTNPLIVADGAHTAKSIKHCLKTLKDFFSLDSIKQNSSFSLLFACAMDKNADAIADLLVQSNFFENIVITRPGLVKQTNLPKIFSAFENALNNKDKNTKNNQKIQLELIENHEIAIEMSIKKALDTQSFLLVTGSFYLVSELSSFLEKSKSKSSSSA